MLKWLAALICVAPLAASAEGVGSISGPDLLARLGGAGAPVVLDVRTPGEYREGHVPGAINIPYDELPARLPELEPDEMRDVVVYCRSGRRARIAADGLMEAGFDVLHLTGDMNAWSADGLPISKP